MSYECWHVHLVILYKLVCRRDWLQGKLLYTKCQHKQAQSSKSFWVWLNACVFCCVKAVYQVQYWVFNFVATSYGQQYTYTFRAGSNTLVNSG